MVNKMMTCLAVSTKYRRVTVGRTDGRTSCDGLVRPMHSIAREKLRQCHVNIQDFAVCRTQRWKLKQTYYYWEGQSLCAASTDELMPSLHSCETTHSLNSSHYSARAALCDRCCLSVCLSMNTITYEPVYRCRPNMVSVIKLRCWSVFKCWYRIGFYHASVCWCAIDIAILSVRPSVCPSRSGTLLKRLNISS